MDNKRRKVAMSIHMFRSLIDGMHAIQNDDSFETQKDLLKSAGIDQELSNEKVEDIRYKSDYLGKSGWTICPFWRARSGESWYDTWFWLAYNHSAETIASYFLEDGYALLKNINGYTMFLIDRSDWFSEATELFDMKYYTSCAMILTAILEQSIRKAPIKTWREKLTFFLNDGIQKNIEEYYDGKRMKLLDRYFEMILILPSINAFVENCFNSGHRFSQDNKIAYENEPSYLERNWLMHGMTKRQISETDCIKLFNVLCSLNYIMNTLLNIDYRL